MKRLQNLLLAIFVSVGAVSYGQGFSDNLAKADQAFADGNYYAAALYYESVIKNGNISEEGRVPHTNPTSNVDARDFDTYVYAIGRLAESYKLIYDYVNAEKWYGVKVSLNEKPVAKDLYNYATMLRANGKFDEAELRLKQAKRADRVAPELVSKINFELECVEFARKAVAFPQAHEVKKLDETTFNVDEASNYAVSPIYSDYMLFTSTRNTRASKRFRKTMEYYNSLFGYKDGKLYNLSFVGIEEMDMATPSMTADQSRVYFTMWDGASKYDEGGKKELYMATRVNDQTWNEPILLDSLLGSRDGENRYPYVTRDGSTLYFASDRSGGLGGFDIYSVRLNAQGLPMGSPVNLGGTINTKSDEITPYYDEVSSTLYFSTDGRVGLGDLDIFSSQRIADDWSTPENLGAPLNSSGADAYFVKSTNKNRGFISSDRDKGCCYEIFEFELVYKAAAGYVYDKVTGQKIDSVSITMRDSTGKTVIATTLAENGLYGLPIDPNQSYTVEATHPDYLDGKASFQTYLSFAQDTTWIDPIIMIPTKKGTDIVLENIYYDYGKATLRPESYPTLDFLAEQLNKYKDLKVELGSHTDSKGSEAYNLGLSNRRSQSCVDYLIKKGVSRERLVAKGYGESKPVAPNTNPDGSDNPEGRQKNRRTTFKFID